ncbi:binary toxin-like calcium binding domain-containing protein [Bacillus thuringiensis]|uniref:binary toxin-like calcium binding domain-containing protein n=1 Tax=Bacillus thuringiensis TaxID=1428 RepID=UPI0011A11AB8|nr:binary toxin-like calcium binding domain-containing protein [Bacillus thuringiensis]
MTYLTGLLGYYFTSQNPEPINLAFIYADQTSLLAQVDTSNIQCIRWEGYIKPSVTGEYYFYTSADSNVILTINGTVVINLNNVTAITLNKDQLYLVRLEYRANANQLGTSMSPLQLFWSYNNGDIMSIPNENILQPDSFKGTSYEQDADTSVFYNTVSNATDFVVDESDEELAEDSDLDTDGDSIPNKMEQQGWKYDRLTGKVDFWKSDADGPKYVTNPLLYSTAGDPFSDLQHVNDNAPGANGKANEVVKSLDAKHPLVAIFPSVRVHIDGFIMTSNATVSQSNQTQNSSTVASSNMSSKTTHWDVNASVNASVSFPWGASVGVSVGGGYGESNTNSSTAELSKTSGTTETHEFSYQPSNAAKIGFIVRYENIGTATIEHVQPNFNVYLDKETIPFLTIDVKEVNQTLTLAPGQVSPQTFISTNDSFAAGSINIPKPYQEKILSGVPIRIEVRDVKGHFGADPTKNQWSHFESAVKDRTARLTLIGKDNKTYDRHIACRSLKKNDDSNYTPDITLKNAILLAFGGEERGEGVISFQDKGITFDKHSNIVLDKNVPELTTAGELQNVMNMNLRPGMGFHIYETAPIPETNPTDQDIILDFITTPANSLQALKWIERDGYSAWGIRGKCVLTDSGPFWDYYNRIKKILRISKGYPTDASSKKLQSEASLSTTHFEFDGTYFWIKIPGSSWINKGEVLRVSYIDPQTSKQHVMCQWTFDADPKHMER